ncbi:Hypothetical protein NTJ_00598 [Nesidiocoris tenuis]|uniref:DUF4794 domain-containing protein n=1 Tax=Nesidiocoris tenuis TaxID=355587 RepID=A0ABN7A6D6_9HEMI|nr:Hypothetical protein NTJ_00598 [Nesidiocoris tenuis]
MATKAIARALLSLVALSAAASAYAYSYPMFNGVGGGASVSGGRKQSFSSSRAWTPYPIVYPARVTRPYAPYYDGFASIYDGATPETSGDLLDLLYPADTYERQYYTPQQYYGPQYYTPQQYYPPQQYYYYEEDEPEEQVILEDEDGTVVPEEWYDSPNGEANAIFLQNLVMAQMYKDALTRSQKYKNGGHPPVPPYNSYRRNEDYDEDGEPYIFGEPVREVGAIPIREAAAPTKVSTKETVKEDKDVRDLKSLVDNTSKQRRKSGDVALRKSLEANRWLNKRDGTTTSSSPLMATSSPLTITNNEQQLKGQDEFVISRGAGRARGAESYHTRSYQPSAYDAIKKMLIQQDNEVNRQPQKRSYVLNEDSLVEQLGKLKKTSF